MTSRSKQKHGTNIAIECFLVETFSYGEHLCKVNVS